MIDFGLQGRVLYVTGGGSGIGRAIATLAAQGGMKVAVADAIGDRAEEVAGALRKEGAQTLALTLDVRDAAACSKAVERIEAALGPIDGMVACAGVSTPSRAEDMSDEVWLRCMDVNLTGMFRSVQPVGRSMLKRKRGSIVTISSIDGLGGHAGRSHYSASKHGVIGLTRALAIEWGSRGVRVNSIAPGVVDTPLVRQNLPADHVQHAMVDRVPLGRLATAEEQAGPTLFLLSDAAAFVNGAVLPVDGGTSSGSFTRWNGGDLGSKALLEAGVYGAPEGGMTKTPDARDVVGDFAPKLVDLTQDVLFADIWERPGLSKRDRSLITCAALVATGRTEQMSFHFPRAVENGVTVDEIVEMITHLAFYAGWPSAMSAILRAKELFEKKQDK